MDSNTIKGEIITIPEESTFLVDEIFNTPMTPERLRAINTLSTGTIPPEALKQHPGRGGKIFTYLSHVWATKFMNAGLKWLWEFQVMSFEAFDDGSAVALCRLNIYIPIGKGKSICRTFQEIGAWESQEVHFEKKVNKKIKEELPGQTTVSSPVVDIPLDSETPEETRTRIYGMSKAMVVASAASRGLLRCMLRAFNIGAEFYDDDMGVTNVQAWRSLEKYANGKGMPTEELIKFIKDLGIKKEELADRYHELFTKLYSIISEKEGIPSDLE
jgi:hypothetical protein